MRNADLRNEIKAARLYYCEVAEQLQVSENTLYRLLRSNLTGEQKDKIKKAIEQARELVLEEQKK